MAEPTTQPPPETSGQDFVYRPLSGVAVAAVTIGGLYAVILVVCAAIALWRGDPFLLPLWLLLLPIAGVILALLGRWHILRSEDTRAGMALTGWALGISLVTGLGYATFYIVTGLAITTQANNFLLEKGPDSGFLTRLTAGDINTAFLLTRPLSERSGANPNNQTAMEEQFDLQQPGDRNPGGLLTLFARDPVVRRLVAAGKSAKIEPLAVKSWNYENKGYKVERSYRIETPEGSFEVAITTQSTSVPGENYKWYVHWQPKIGWSSDIKRTPEGQKLFLLRRQAAIFANAWFEKIFRHEVLPAYLDTQPPSDRRQLEQNAKTLDRMVYPPWVAEVLRKQFKEKLLPGLEEFLRGQGCLHSDQLRAPGQLQHLLRQRLAEFVKDPIQGQFPIRFREREWEESKIEEAPAGRVRVFHHFDFPVKLFLTPKHSQEARILGEIVLEAAAGVDPNNAADLQRWQVVRVNFLRALATPPGGSQQKPKGGPEG